MNDEIVANAMLACSEVGTAWIAYKYFEISAVLIVSGLFGFGFFRAMKSI